MNKSQFYLISGVLGLQALIYLVLSLGSVVDIITYLLSGVQSDLSYLSILALPSTTDLSNVTSIWSVTLSFLGAITFLILAYTYGFKTELGRIWVIFAIATFLYFGGESIWFYYVFTTGTIPNGVTLADVSWLSGYPFYIIGLLLLNRQIALSIKKSTFYIFTIIVGIISLVILYILGIAIYAVPDTSFIDSTVYYSYVIGDLLVLYLAVLIFLKFSGGGEIRRSYMLLILAFIANAAGDILYAFTSYILGIYQTYAFDFADAMFIIGYTLLIIGPLTYYYLVSKVYGEASDKAEIR